jgi:hypothetical protein
MPDMSAVVVPHNFDQIYSEILAPSCAGFSVCHSAAGAPTLANKLNLAMMNLDNTPNDPYLALVGAMSVNTQALAEGKLRVKPCDSTNSFLTIKLTLPLTATDPMVGYGEYMPQGSGHLPDTQIQAIKDWIDRGALRTESATVTGKTCQLVADMAAAHD